MGALLLLLRRVGDQLHSKGNPTCQPVRWSSVVSTPSTWDLGQQGRHWPIALYTTEDTKGCSVGVWAIHVVREQPARMTLSPACWLEVTEDGQRMDVGSSHQPQLSAQKAPGFRGL